MPKTTAGPILAIAVLAVAALATLGCEQKRRPIGERCQVLGEGTFLGKDPCEHVCINRSVTCPNGARLRPDVCSGEECTVTGNCPTGQVCVRLGPQRDYCMPEDECL